jgi:hypothetical protein
MIGDHYDHSYCKVFQTTKSLCLVETPCWEARELMQRSLPQRTKGSAHKHNMGLVDLKEPLSLFRSQRMDYSGGIMTMAWVRRLLLAFAIIWQVTIPMVLGAPKNNRNESVPGLSQNALPSAYQRGFVPPWLSFCSFFFLYIYFKCHDNKHFILIEVVKDSQIILVS